MDAKLKPGTEADPIYICPVCEGPLQYWASYDVLLCPTCMGRVYDPDTGEEQGPIE